MTARDPRRSSPRLLVAHRARVARAGRRASRRPGRRRGRDRPHAGHRRAYTVQPSKSRVRVTMAVTPATTAARRRPTSTTSTTRSWPSSPARAGSTSRARRAAVGLGGRSGPGTRPCSGSTSAACTAASAAVVPAHLQPRRPGTAGEPRRSAWAASLVTFPVWAFASNGARGSRVTVRFPAGYDVAVENGAFDSNDEDRGRRARELATQPLAEPLDYFAYVSAPEGRPSTRRRRSRSGGGQDQVDLLLRGWRDDPAWSDARRRPVPRGLPGLRSDDRARRGRRPGSRRPGGGEPEHRRRTPACSIPPTSRIEVAYWADPPSSIHEAAHGWFNGGARRGPLGERGVRVALRAARGRGRSRSAARAQDQRRASASPRSRSTPGRPHERGRSAATPTGRRPTRYGYAASLALPAAIAERAGDDTLHGRLGRRRRDTGAVPAGRRRTAARPGTARPTPARPRRSTGRRTGAALLDLLEAETGKDFTDLWREWVVRPEEAGAARRPRGGADRVRADARARRRLGAAALHPRRPARVAVRRPPSARWPTPGRCSRSAARWSRSPRGAGSRCPTAMQQRCSRRATWPVRRARPRPSATRCSA